ncbi:universal stress protein [Marinomonas fungiae]|uniref:Nucleotide-binding universal stress protein, UspA family n=1 Tax=Marinomonas fungiae TaxID=1137284 RepID=A0A0K6IJQ8_9GAMM|nr:universal stress protein [Marinomonas fungiae]CUB03329.1 Nucleotide-binding universal stress protein, UspA family [Marinomonas fungiae]
MYRKIMVPVDLGHIERLEKALKTAADMAKTYNIPICYVGVNSSAPSNVAHSSNEFEEMIKVFAREQAEKYMLDNVTAVAYSIPDPTVDLDATLIKAEKENGVDLVVMASHVPGLSDHIFASNAGYVAKYSKVSVLVVR